MSLKSDVYDVLSVVMASHPEAGKEHLDEALSWFSQKYFEETKETEEEDDWMEEEWEEDRGAYSPSAPWNAPGMKVSDFITGVVY